MLFDPQQVLLCQSIGAKLGARAIYIFGAKLTAH